MYIVQQISNAEYIFVVHRFYFDIGRVEDNKKSL
jgi:hypothetical protein